MKPTDEQDAIVAAVRTGENLMIKAFAGTGKTSTMVMAAKEVKSNALALAFNKKNAVELEKRLPQSFTAKTLNSLGHGAWAKAIGQRRLILDERKLGRLINDRAEFNRIKLNQEEWSTVRIAVSLARHGGLIPAKYSKRGLLPDDEATWESFFEAADPDSALVELSRQVLVACIQESYKGTIDFDDQIYMSALFGGVFPRFDAVVVDEAQDLSLLNHRMLARLGTGQLIVVGDPCQAIYAFRGADYQSMDRMRALRQSWRDLKLSVTFRCPTAIVARQQDHVPGYTAHESNAAGEVQVLKAWTLDDLPSPLRHPTALLCRNNAPLISMAFKLLRRGIPVTMLGRDIGKGLLALVKKLAPEPIPTTQFLTRLRQWAAAEIEIAKVKNQPNKIELIEDKYESLEVLAEGVGDSGQLVIAITKIFESDGKIVLSTGHRAKGAEWDSVVHLDPWRIPSKWAKAAADEHGDTSQLRQEKNLRYVIETRTKNYLTLASVDQFDSEEVSE